MTGLTVDADVADSVDLFGKVASGLQTGVEVDNENKTIRGTVKYIADYSSAGYTGDEKSGNFLVIHAEVPDVTGVTLTAELIGGTHGVQTLDEDGILISRITNKNSQMIRIVARKDGYDPVSKTFSLKRLTLSPAT